MDNSNKWYSKINYHALIYGVLSFIIVILYWNFNSKLEALHRSNKPQKQIKVNEQDWDFAKKYFDTEINFIKSNNVNDYKLDLYLLDSLYPNQPVIQLKLNFLNNYKSLMNNTDEELREFWQAKFNNLKFNYSKRLDSMVHVYQKDTSKLKQEIFLLNAIVEKKKQQNQFKNKIQVISFTSSKGHKVSYIGEVENGKANGGGEGVWSTGSIYKGQWKDNLRNGKGRYEWIDGQVYYGEYLMGKRNGEGVYKWPSGERYEGNWLNDKRNGFGRLYDRDGNLKYEGEWEDDKPNK